MERPDSGLNDAGFHISPDTLQRVEQRRELEGWDSISCGILADNSRQVLVRVFVYEQLRNYPAIRIEDPAQAYPNESVYSMAFGYDYVVVLTTGNEGEFLKQGEEFGQLRPATPSSSSPSTDQ